MMPIAVMRLRNPSAAVANNTIALLHFDGTNGSTTFIDESGKVWTGAGNAQLSTAQQEFGPSSLLLDGVSDFLTTPYSAGFSVVSSYTVECWIRRVATGRDAIYTNYDNVNNGCSFQIGATDLLSLTMGTGTYISLTGTTTIPINTWTHVAGVKDGATLRIFVNGTQEGTLAVTGTPADQSLPSYIGRDPLDSSRDFGGYIDEFRFSNVARYTSNFTPSGPFTYPG